MKDWGIYSGCLLSSYYNYISINGSFVKFDWWELIFIAVFLLIKIVFWGIAFGVAAKIIQESIKEAKEQWTGKKKDLKPVT